jgi:hypothetical protein
MRRRTWRKGERRSMTSAELQLEILQAVKTAPDCENLIGVFVQPTTPKTDLEANWEIQGVRFGNADRKIVNEALTTVVSRLQQKYRISAPK